MFGHADLRIAPGFGRPSNDRVYTFQTFESSQGSGEQRLPFGADAPGHRIVGQQERVEKRVLRCASPISRAQRSMASILGEVRFADRARTSLHLFPHGTGVTDLGQRCQRRRRAGRGLIAWIAEVTG